MSQSACAPAPDERPAAADALGEPLRSLFADLAHGGDVDVAAASPLRGERVLCGQAGSRQGGTQVRFQLRVRMQDRQVLEARYRAYGCPYTLATCEWLARRLSGQTLPTLSPQALDEALERPLAQPLGGATDWAAQLAAPAVRLGRLLVIEDALRAALASVHTCADHSALCSTLAPPADKR